MKRFIRLVFTLTLALVILTATSPSLISAANNLQTPTNSGSSKTGTVRIQLRGCTDGIDPNTAPQECDIPLDAPLYSSLVARDDPQS